MTEDCNISDDGKTSSVGASQGRAGSVPVWLAGAIAVVLLVATGVAYRVYASGLKEVLDKPVELPVPLSGIPMEIGGWSGEDLSIPTTTREYMKTNFADDYISRRYLNATKNIWADLYVVYCASKPAGILGHQPRICFPAHGWIWDETKTAEVELRSGNRIKCLIHLFHKPAPEYREVFVVSFWVLNGQITLSEREFSGFFGRRPNISGDPARYVAQLQISSTVEHSVRAAASDLVDTIMAFLPDEQGQIDASVAPTTLGTGEEAD